MRFGKEKNAVHSELTRNFNRKGVGHPSAEEAGKLYMQAVQSWLKEFEKKITPNHSLRCNMARVSISNGKMKYERTADLVLKGSVSGM